MPVAETPEGERPAAGPAPLLFVAAIFASAFLIFLVQPMVGKRILPWFGGAPAVWTLCLAFYQTSLFAGYAYAHALVRLAPPGLQLGLHAAAVGAAIVVLPVLPGEAWRPEGVGSPRLDILEMLVAKVALPFLVLASTGPLVQAWFARRYPARSPYPLYAVSNLGSLLALVAYPFFLEPRFGLAATDGAWSIGFALTGAAIVGCAFLARRPGERAFSREATAHDGEGEARAVDVALWLLLPGCAVMLLMGVTNKVGLDVASVPFLWVMPLATYLLTFIIGFSSERAYSRAGQVALAALAFAASVGSGYWMRWLELPPEHVLISAWIQIPAYCLLLFSTCMVMHGELYRLRPPARSLTLFYLCVSAGGAIGGIFVGIFAPTLFDDYYELPIGLAFAALLLLAACARDPRSLLAWSAPRWRMAVVLASAAVLLGFAFRETTQATRQLVHRERGFFGVLRIMERGEGESAQRQLTSGTTLHGVQFVEQELRRLPGSYYGRATPIGMVMSRVRRGPPKRVGVIGLGVGTLSTYGREEDYFRYYEIDPAVIRLARDYFSFLTDALPSVDVVMGDARLSLAREQADDVPQAFDVLVVDAFSSDAIPVHLLTAESFEHYTRALAPGGLLAVHLSNRHFDLPPVVSRLGAEIGLSSLQTHSSIALQYQSQPAAWVFLARDVSVLGAIAELLQRRSALLTLPPTHVTARVRPAGRRPAGAPLDRRLQRPLRRAPPQVVGRGGGRRRYSRRMACDWVYERDGEVFAPSEWAGSPWSDGLQHGGPVQCALRARCRGGRAGGRPARRASDGRPLPAGAAGAARAPLAVRAAGQAAGERRRHPVAAGPGRAGEPRVRRAAPAERRPAPRVGAHAAAPAAARAARAGRVHARGHARDGPARVPLELRGPHRRGRARTRGLDHHAAAPAAGAADVAAPALRGGGRPDVRPLRPRRCCARRIADVDAWRVAMINTDTTIYWERPAGRRVVRVQARPAHRPPGHRPRPRSTSPTPPDGSAARSRRCSPTRRPAGPATSLVPRSDRAGRERGRQRRPRAAGPRAAFSCRTRSSRSGRARRSGAPPC